ncbi:MAG: peptide deformylase [Acidobacteriota bacterium]|nr:peptide deformylase [Acidobacteriota bacterium]
MKPLPLVQLQADDFFAKDTSLRDPCKLVTEFSDSLRKDVAALLATFHSHKIAVGLAAPQVGIQSSVCVVNVSKNKMSPNKLFINPKITTQSEQTEIKFESCMSLPDVRGKVERSLSVKVEYEDEKGVRRQIEAEGFLARVLQHEIDHLNGILYVDRMSSPESLEPTDIFKND